jgi:chorismate-pyruvate lyase
MPEKTETLPAKSVEFSVVHPLDDFYAAAGQSLPPFDEIEGEAVPEPYRTLLVHKNDMTPTLEKYHGFGVHLDVLGRRSKGDAYFREVILRLDGTNQPVEFGAIKINLDRFTAGARKEILAECLPLGHILNEFKIPHTSRPRAYLRLATDKLISRVLEMNGAHVLYGRRNTLYDPQQRPLAEIVEILPVATINKTK